MLDAAGQNRDILSHACQVYNGGVGEGDVVQTDSYNELCQEIVHCICHQEFKSGQVMLWEFLENFRIVARLGVA